MAKRKLFNKMCDLVNAQARLNDGGGASAMVGCMISFYKTNRLFVCLMLFCQCISYAYGWPGYGEVAIAKPLVKDLIEPEMAAFKSGEKSIVEVATTVLQYANLTEKEAEKWLLLKLAYKCAVKSKDYDMAAEIVNTINKTINDVPDIEIVNLIKDEVAKGEVRQTGMALVDIYKIAKSRVDAQNILQKQLPTLKKNPHDYQNRKAVAEAYILLGKWPEALKEYSQMYESSYDPVRRIAKLELDGKGEAEEIADYWWSYTPADPRVKSIVRKHAAKFYAKALATGSIPVLKQKIFENRIKETEAVENSNKPATVIVQNPKMEYHFNYTLDEEGNAIICRPDDETPCVNPLPEGNLNIPEYIDNHLVTTIHRHAFRGCDKMTGVILPKSIRNLDPSWISYTPSLERIEVAWNNKHFVSIQGVLYSKDKKMLIAYPKTRTEIKLLYSCKVVGEWAFSGCCKFKILKIPQGVESVCMWAFGNCKSLESVEFPMTIKYLGRCLFFNCNSLRKVTFLGDAPNCQTRVRHKDFRTIVEGIWTYAPEEIEVKIQYRRKNWTDSVTGNLPRKWPNDHCGRPISYLWAPKYNMSAPSNSTSQPWIKKPRSHWNSFR